jgi:hypothetical protein
MAFVDVVVDPSVESPDMAFNTGQVVNGVAVMDPSLPEVPGPESSWTVTEWGKVDYLNPTAMTAGDTSLADPNYGDPLYTWQAADGLTSLSVYSEGQGTTAAAPYVYDLEESDGTLNGGGTNLFLSSDIDSSSLVTFDHPVVYRLDAKLNVASVSGPSVDLAQVFTGFIVTFNASGNPGYDAGLPTINAFMQVAMSGSGTAHARYEVQDGNTIIYTYTLPEDQVLAYQATSGGPTLLSYNLNQYLDDLIANDPALPAQAQDLGLWNLGSMYIGLETENGTLSDPNQGQVSVGLQVSNIQVQTDASQTVAYETPSTFETTPPPAIPPTLFTMVDTTQADGATPITGDSYNGPLSFLSHGDAYSYVGSDNVQIAAVHATNPLIASGSGEDLLTGSATGSSVLDGGTGANIETDGGSGDTTFVQNGYVSGATWDFLQNVHGSDEDIMFGYIPGFSKISVQANGGLAFDKGATVTIDPGNGNTEEVTFVGISASALHGCSADIEGVPSWVLWT